MNKNLLKKRNLLNAFFILSLMLSVNMGWGQQVIGSFPYMNGGFEGQASGVLGTSLTATSWSRQNQSGASSSITTTTPRTGVNYANVTNVTAASRGLQSPQLMPFVAGSTPLANTAYMVQFWVRNAASVSAFQVGTNVNGTADTNYSSSSYSLPINTSWTKYTIATTTKNVTVATSGIAVIGRSLAGTFDVDDVVIYPGTAEDVIAPDAATSPSITNVVAGVSQTVSWFAPGTGVDGGGYMVVRNTTDPSTAPNANGIYAVGSFVAENEKVVYIGTNTTFSDALPTAGNYYYRIYSVDKAFNYCASPAKVNNDNVVTTLASLPSSQASNITFSSVTSSSFTINFTAGGTKSIVVMSSSPINADPVNGVSYTTSANIAGGTKVVYNGTGNSVSLTGLSKGIYYVKVYAFDGSAGTENYLTTSPPSNSQVVIAEITSAASGLWTTAATWVGSVVPTQYDNVTISAGHIVDVAGPAKCFNLTIPATAKVWSNTNASTLQIYGTSLVSSGTLGDPINVITTGSALTIEFGGNLTISGAGGIYPFKLRPITGLTDIGVTFDANATVTGTGSTVIFDNVGNDNIYYTVNSPRTLNIFNNFNSASGSATQSTSNNTLTINSGATVNVGGVHNTNEAAGKTYTANINGTLAVTGTSTLSGTSGGGSVVFNINGTYTSTGDLKVTPTDAFVAPVINVGSTGSITVAGTADFSNPNLVGYIGNAPTTTGGIFTLSSTGSIKLANASGLEPIAGPIRTTTRNFTSGSSYSFVGNVAQVTGSEMPSEVGGLTINNTHPDGVTLTSSSNVNGSLLVSSGTLITGSNLFRLGISATATFSPTSALSISGGVTNFNDRPVTFQSAATGTAQIKTITGALFGATNVTVERYIPAKRAWRALTSPVSTTTSIFTNWQENGANSGAGNGVNGFDIWMPGGSNGLTAGGSSNSLLEYNSANNTWTGITATNGSSSMMNGNKNKPFMAFVTGPFGFNNVTAGATATTIRATGTLYTGNQTYANTATQYSFIGNPYASPLDPSLLLADTDNTAFEGNIWVWDANATGSNSVGTYNLFNNGTYSNVTSNPAVTTGTQIQSGQAFFVKSTTGGTFTIKETHKGTTFSNAVFRTATPELFRVGLYKQVNNEWSGRDGAMTVILSDANANQSPNKMVNSTENIAFTKNGASFASNHHLPLVSSDVLNVKVWNTTVGANYKLKINTEAFTATNLSATLEDLFTNSRTPLNLEGTAVEYPFTVTNEALSSGDRFRIVFQNAVLGNNNPTENGFSIVPNPVTGDSFQVNLGALAIGTYSYSICNSLGQEIEKGSIQNATQNNNYDVKMSNVATGIYIMKIKGSDNSVFTAKIIKK